MIQQDNVYGGDGGEHEWLSAITLLLAFGNHKMRKSMIEVYKIMENYLWIEKNYSPSLLILPIDNNYSFPDLLLLSKNLNPNIY